MSDSLSIAYPDPEMPMVTNISRSSVDTVRSESVRMNQSAARNITADEVELRMSAAVDIRASMVEVGESGLGLVKANEVSLANSTVAAIDCGTVTLNGAAGLVMARTVNLGKTFAGVVAGGGIRGQRIETLALLGNRVEGEVHTMVDSRDALIAGLVGGLFGGLIFSLTHALFRPD